jgi:ATP-dependent helicase/nuclease subunit B
MTGIAKIDSPAGWGANFDDGHPSVELWVNPSNGLFARIREAMCARNAHPARTLILLPYAQLLPLAARLWTRCFPDGFSPRFETTLNWTTALGNFVPGPTDIAFDVAQDTLTAGALLRAAGLGSQRDKLAALLVQAAHQLAPMAAACLPDARKDWAQQARRSAVIGMESPALAIEASLARIAVEWAAQSAYASDMVFSPETVDVLDCLVVVSGLSSVPMVAALKTVWADRLVHMPLLADVQPLPKQIDSRLSWHACQDAEDEAQRAASCAIAHISADRIPVAMVSSDRALTRRIRSMLESVGVQMRDETGWKLSTSHAAAQVMATLRAAVWSATSDAVLCWLKLVPDQEDGVSDLERALRRDRSALWSEAGNGQALQVSSKAMAMHGIVEGLRDSLQQSRTLPAWLSALRHALQSIGLWNGLETDGPGAEVLAALHLAQPAMPEWENLCGVALWSQRRMDLAEFTHWVNQVLEGANFSPVYPLHEQVVILPLSQMLARPFAAAVMAGCDEVRLDPAPEPPGGWTAAQRAALGLPAREDLKDALGTAWFQALRTPYCDVLWRCSDDSGEALLPSALVQSAQIACCAQALAADPRQSRTVVAAPVSLPRPTGDLLPVTTLSASAYEDLRTCPFRFFAMRQLGLQSVDELDTVVDKRDFGLWLHEVLRRFHEALQGQGGPDGSERELLDQASEATTQSMGLADGEFLPFAAAWPTVRDGYLRWLEHHQATGAAFACAESLHSQRVGSVRLIGRIDRIDKLANGQALVMDYKTEGAARTAARIREPFEDTQIAFYVALLPHDTLQGAYVNVGEREGTRFYAQSAVGEARDALIAGLLQDMDRIAAGEPLPALGDGAACDFCQARGLCRKDFWI